MQYFTRVWTKLEAVYASKGPARKATLLERLTEQKMQNDDDLNTHLAQFFDAVDTLKAIQSDINGDLLTITLLYSLPDSFENFRCAIESRDNLPDVEALKIKIIEEHNARSQKSSDGNSTAMFARNQKSSSKFQQKGKGGASGYKNSSNANDSNKVKSKSDTKIQYKCNYCHKKGHKESECWHKRNASK